MVKIYKYNSFIKTFLIIIVIFISLMAFQTYAKEAEYKAPRAEYCIDISDILEINIWRIPDLSRDVIVRPDGRISLPLIGDVDAAGLTLTQLDEALTKTYSVYIKNPQVSVAVKKFGGNKVVVLGEVVRPGVYKYDVPPRLVEVIADAGGYTNVAVLRSVVVIRDTRSKKPKAVRVNALRAIKTGDPRSNIVINSNEVVFIPRSFVGNLSTFMQTITPTINAIYQTATTKDIMER